MKQSSLSRPVSVSSAWALSLFLVATLGGGDWDAAHAQSPIIAIGPPSFQNLVVPSLEDQVLYRLSFVGPREPGDLMQLARLAELRTIGTLATVRYQLSGTVASVQLEREGFALWNATDAFDQAIWYLPPDVQNLAWSQLLLTDVQAAYGRLNSSLGALPAISPRGAFYLQGISQILPFAQSELQLIEADIIPPAPYPAVRPVSLAELREQVRLLARDLAELIGKVRESQGDVRARDSVVAELSRFLELASSFDRILAIEPPTPDVLESFRLFTRGARQAWAALVGANRSGAWRPLRDRLNIMSDSLQLPRAVGSLEARRIVPPRTTDLLALIDQASDLLAAAQGAPPASDTTESLASTRANQARRLQIKLLELRQHALTADSLDELGPRLREIEALSQRAEARPQAAPALFRGGRLDRPSNLEQVEQTISRLRRLVGAGSPAR